MAAIVFGINCPRSTTYLAPYLQGQLIGYVECIHCVNALHAQLALNILEQFCYCVNRVPDETGNDRTIDHDWIVYMQIIEFRI